MTAKIIEIQQRPSKWGGIFYHVLFKDANGKNFYTYVYPRMRNFSRWKKVLNKGINLTDLKLMANKNNLIDADSNFKVKEQ
jgi:hypothetical protein